MYLRFLQYNRDQWHFACSLKKTKKLNPLKFTDNLSKSPIWILSNRFNIQHFDWMYPTHWNNRRDPLSFTPYSLMIYLLQIMATLTHNGHAEKSKRLMWFAWKFNRETLLNLTWWDHFKRRVTNQLAEVQKHTFHWAWTGTKKNSQKCHFSHLENIVD